MVDPQVNPPQVEPPAPKAEMIPADRLDHVLKDMHRFKEEARQAQEKLKLMEDAKLKANSSWEELAKVKEQEAKDANDKLTKLTGALVTKEKYSAVERACSAIGLRKEAVSDLELVGLDDVQIETTSTGRMNVLNADKFAERLKAIRPHWFSTPGAPNVNTNGAQINPGQGQITMKDVLAAEVESKKSGDPTKYHETFKKFQEQRKRA